jgi:CDP-paratose 2-epimerase
VLVTGGAGFIGSHVAEFYSQGNHVTIYDNLSRSQTLGTDKRCAKYNLNYLRRENPRIEVRQADVRDFQSLKGAAHDAEVIIHTAGQVAVTTSLKDPRSDFESNASGTLNVLEVARLNDSTVLFCSTNKVYGENVNSILVKEHSRRYGFGDPRYVNGIPENFPVDHTGHSPYGSSKLAADIYAQDYAHTYGLKTGIFRMSCIYGERQFGVEDQGWLAWFIIASLTGQRITIYGDGKQVRDVLYVRDLIEAFEKFVRSKIHHGVFNVGGGPANTLSVLELIDLIKKRTGRLPAFGFDHWRPADQKVYVSDIRKASESLGWKPRTSPLAGVGRLIRWVESNRDLFGQKCPSRSSLTQANHRR